MTDEDSTPAASSRNSPFSFLRPQFCLKASIGFLIVAFCGGMLFPAHSDILIIPGISLIMGLMVGIWGSVTGLVRWSRNDRSARRCTIILLIAVLLLLLMLLPAL